MLTKNFFAATLATGLRRSVSNVCKNTKGEAADLFGSENYNIAAQHFVYTHAMRTTDTEGVWIGNGKTPATADDYKLESRITSGISITNQNYSSVSVTEDGLHLSATYGVRNTGGDPLEISEIGLVTYYNTKSATTGDIFLIERTVLETPIVIPVGESRQITYTISLRYPK